MQRTAGMDPTSRSEATATCADMLSTSITGWPSLAGLLSSEYTGE